MFLDELYTKQQLEDLLRRQGRTRAEEDFFTHIYWNERSMGENLWIVGVENIGGYRRIGPVTTVAFNIIKEESQGMRVISYRIGRAEDLDQVVN